MGNYGQQTQAYHTVQSIGKKIVPLRINKQTANLFKKLPVENEDAQ